MFFVFVVFFMFMTFFQSTSYKVASLVALQEEQILNALGIEKQIDYKSTTNNSTFVQCMFFVVLMFLLSWKEILLNCLLFSGAPARIRTADLLITNQEYKFKKINIINVNWKLFQFCTHYRHSGIFFYV